MKLGLRWNQAICGFALVALATAAGCGDDDSAGDDAASAQRYCDFVTIAEAHGEEVFAEVDYSDEDALVAAEQEMFAWVRDNAPSTGDLPAEISSDVTEFLAGQERLASGAEPTLEQQEAEQRLLDWEESNCPS